MSTNPGNDPSPGPLAYLITFTCYGTRLHGEGPYRVQRTCDGRALIPPDGRQLTWRQRDLKQQPYRLDGLRRETVLKSIRESANYQGWTLHAAHVRTDHVHLVLAGIADPGKALTNIKTYASRHLNDRGFDTRDRRRWTRGHSIKGLYTERSVLEAIRYVIEQTGEPMSLFDGATTWPTK